MAGDLVVVADFLHAVIEVPAVSSFDHDCLTFDRLYYLSSVGTECK